MKVFCDKCKVVSDVNMYFYNPHIIPQACRPGDPEEYKAVVSSKTICPNCGHALLTTFTSQVFKEDIVDLATRNARNRYATTVCEKDT